MNGDDIGGKRPWHSAPVSVGTFVAIVGVLVTVMIFMINDRLSLEHKVTQLDERQQNNINAVVKMVELNSAQEKEIADLRVDVAILQRATETKMAPR